MKINEVKGTITQFRDTVNLAESLKKPWTQEELERLKNLFTQNAPKNVIAKKLGRSIVAISHKAAELKLVRLSDPRTPTPSANNDTSQ